MSSDTVISVEHLSKQYRLGLVGTGTLSHDLNRWWCRVRGKPDPTLKVTESNVRDRNAEGRKQNSGTPSSPDSGLRTPDSGLSARAKRGPEYVWALRDINFEVKRGEVLGIIGRNGAGKSTLLKILSRVTAPTEGQIKIKGRLAALLEVGTGFHPELTGRENIYLNGAILGMTKAEITRKLDEIVDFSGCERYIDTPVKRYSSGMMVRLGFAVAAHLEPEILIVDEVLAVGDAEFQKKCLGKMQDVAAGGRTVLFVSHNMAAVQTLVSTCCRIDAGRIADFGEPSAIVSAYLATCAEDLCDSDVSHVVRPREFLGVDVRMCYIKALPPSQATEFNVGEDLRFELHIRSTKEIPGLRFGITITDPLDGPILTTQSENVFSVMAGKTTTAELMIQEPRLAPGQYRMAVSVFEGSLHGARTVHDLLRPAATFAVTGMARTGVPLVNWQSSYGPICHHACRATEVRQVPA